MTNTQNLNLPLVQASQAQKHVTVNEALARLDGFVQLRLLSLTETQPPAAALDGDSYAVPAGASAEWQDNTGDVAVFINGGWEFASPKTGWRAWDIAASAPLFFDGTQWLAEGQIASSQGARTIQRIVEFEHDLANGTTTGSGDVIPEKSIVTGVTGRVTEAVVISGGATWSLGVSGSSDRYGSGYGTALNSFVQGLTSNPLTYWSNEPLVVTPDAGSVTGGKIRFAIHITEIAPPSAV